MGGFGGGGGGGVNEASPWVAMTKPPWRGSTDGGDSRGGETTLNKALDVATNKASTLGGTLTVTAKTSTLACQARPPPHTNGQQEGTTTLGTRTYFFCACTQNDHTGLGNSNMSNRPAVTYPPIHFISLQDGWGNTTISLLPDGTRWEGLRSD